MFEKFLMKLMPNFVKRIERLEERMNTEMVARKNEVNRIEKEVKKDWVGDEIESDEKERMINTLESKDIVDTEILL